jgi:organic radical activating enzyme
MAQIKVSELFYSLQGEGRYTGVPSIFLRTFGCNFTCQGFGMPAGQLSREAAEVALVADQYEKYEDLPLVHTGCDSYASWHQNFKHLSPMLDTQSIANTISDLLPYKQWNDEHLVITGGEPLLGWQRAYPALLDEPKMSGLKEITFETNGTQELTNSFYDYLLEWQDPALHREVTFSVSAKLSCSGEPRDKAIKPDIICDYQEVGFTYLKFVVSTPNDVLEALDVVSMYRNAGFTGPVYVMPVGGTTESFYLNNKQVAELALKHGLRFSDRLHIGLFGNAWST